MNLPAFNSIDPPLVDLATGKPDASASEAVGTDVILRSLDAVNDPAFAFEQIPTYHPDGVAERARIAAARNREVSHYVVRRSRRWERVGFDRVDDDETITTVVETGSDIELTDENKRVVSERLKINLGYGDYVNIEGEISQNLEFNHTGVFKTSTKRTDTVEKKRVAGGLYVHWQIVEIIEMLRARKGRTTLEPVSTISGRGALVTVRQPLKKRPVRKGKDDV